MKLDDAIELIVRAWESEHLDVVICPGFTYPAPPITNPGRIVPAICYPAVFNVIDFPVGVVPITRVNDQDQVLYYNVNCLICSCCCFFLNPSL